jgi:hypothetical protein
MNTKDIDAMKKIMKKKLFCVLLPFTPLMEREWAEMFLL